MKKNILLLSALCCLMMTIDAKGVKATKEHRELIKQHIYGDYKQMYRQPTGIALKYPYLTPGSQQYARVLWDWDSWLSDVALRQTLNDVGNDNDREEALKYEQGCVLNMVAWLEGRNVVKEF